MYSTVPASLLEILLFWAEAQNLIQSDSVVSCMPHNKSKHTNNEVYAANEPNFLGPISYGTQQVEPQFLMAY